MHEAEYRRIPLFGRTGDLKGHTLIDPGDLAWFEQWTWRLLGSGYVGRTEWMKGAGRSQLILLHRALHGLERGDRRQVDHRNRDRLDNRRANLRVVTPAQQAQNHPSPRHARSALRGVCWVGTGGRIKCWQGRVTVDGKVHYGPRTADENEAGRWAAQKRAELMTHAEG